jgi:hypothetical protein
MRKVHQRLLERLVVTVVDGEDGLSLPEIPWLGTLTQLEKAIMSSRAEKGTVVTDTERFDRLKAALLATPPKISKAKKRPANYRIDKRILDLKPTASDIDAALEYWADLKHPGWRDT